MLRCCELRPQPRPTGGRCAMPSWATLTSTGSAASALLVRIGPKLQLASSHRCLFLSFVKHHGSAAPSTGLSPTSFCLYLIKICIRPTQCFPVKCRHATDAASQSGSATKQGQLAHGVSEREPPVPSTECRLETSPLKIAMRRWLMPRINQRERYRTRLLPHRKTIPLLVSRSRPNVSSSDGIENVCLVQDATE